MVTIRNLGANTAGEMIFEYECDCDEFKNSTAKNCKHIEEIKETRRKEKHEKRFYFGSK
jgi:hypothetical protein